MNLNVIRPSSRRHHFRRGVSRGKGGRKSAQRPRNEPNGSGHRILGGSMILPGKDTMNTTTNSAGRLTLSIDGMSCGHCVQAVTKALAGLPAVRVHSVALGSAEIEAGTSDAANDALAALQSAGYPARVAREEATSPTSARKGGTGGCCGGPRGCCG